jgi:predicted ATPase/DNA-binding SARP family transcriptional activator
VCAVLSVRVLGPIEGWVGERRVGLGGPRQLGLFALLALNANRAISSDAIVDLLWGPERVGANKSLQMAVARVRKALDVAGVDAESTLRTVGHGYLLALAPGELDSERFAALTATGHSALEANEPERAQEVLSEALALWRGPPLTEVGFDDFAQAEIRRLEEMRFLAIEARIEADLMLGHHADLVGELEMLLAARPGREGLAGQLIVALYRCGRQSDALEVYHRVRVHLLEELGLEPGPALQRLQARVLTQDPALAAPDTSGVGQRTARPSSSNLPTPATGNLPVPATPFLGRARELAEVISLISRTETRLLTMTGAGGSGKTRLALRLAQASAPDYRDGAWFVAFADITDPDLIIPTICRALRLIEEPDMTPTERLQAWLRPRSVLLLLDNLEHLAADAAALGVLLASCPELTLVVTSREPLRLAGEQQYEVPVLEPADAIELFTTRAHAVAPSVSIDPHLAGEICERLDCLPLAIELAAARTKTLNAAELNARLDDRLPLLTGGPRDAPRRQQTLRATIDWSHDLLTDNEQRLFARLAVFAGGFTLAAAEAVCDATLDTVQALADRSLIKADTERYWMLQTLREYALEKLGEAGEAAEMRRRHAHWFVELLEPRRGWYRPRDPFLARRLLRDRENFGSALEWAAESGDSETVAWLSVLVSGWVWRRTGQLNEAERWLGLAQKHRAEYPPLLQAKVLSEASHVARGRGERSAGADFCEQALAIYRELGDPEGICSGLSGRNMFAADGGDLVGARAALEEAIRYARANDVPGFLPTALNNLGDVAIEEGNLDEAWALCEEGLIVAETLAATADASILLINLTHIANLQGHVSDAVRLGRKTLKAALDDEDLRTAAGAVMEIAWPLARQGQLERAGRLLGSAMRFYEDSGVTLERTERVCERRTREILCGQFDAHAVRALLAEGRVMPLEDAVRDALGEGHDPDSPHVGITSEPPTSTRPGALIRNGGPDR